MTLRIRVTQPAENDIRGIAQWYSDHAKGLGRKWKRGIRKSIASLDKNPERCGLARETDDLDFDLRELLYGAGRKKTHRILFRVIEKTVEVLAVRHVAQQDFSSDDI